MSRFHLTVLSLYNQSVLYGLIYKHIGCIAIYGTATACALVLCVCFYIYCILNIKLSTYSYYHALLSILLAFHLDLDFVVGSIDFSSLRYSFIDFVPFSRSIANAAFCIRSCAVLPGFL